MENILRLILNKFGIKTKGQIIEKLEKENLKLRQNYTDLFFNTEDYRNEKFKKDNNGSILCGQFIDLTLFDANDERYQNMIKEIASNLVSNIFYMFK